MTLLSRRGFLTAGGAVAATAAAPAAARRRGPNVLFLFADQHRHDWLSGASDLPVHTPHLEALAARGTRFSRAVVPSPLCAPSRACLASGREYPRCGIRGNDQDYPLDVPTFYQALRETGYSVIGCGKLDLHKATLDWGVDGQRFLPEWGFTAGIDNAGKAEAILSGTVEPRDPYMAYLHSRGLAAMHVEDFKRRQGAAGYAVTDPTPLPDEAYCDNWIGNNALELLKDAPAAKPWFLTVNFAGAQEPMDITRRMERLCRNRNFPPPVRSEQLTPERHNAIRQNYTAMVENIDRWVGALIDEVRRRAELDHTLVVYSSDHGEMLGDHERWGKSVPYQPAVGVPLVAAGPGVERGVTSEALVSLMDLAATFLDYAGGAGRVRDMDSRSLRPLLEGKAKTHREFVRSGLGSWRMVFDGRYKLIRGYDPRPEPGGRKRARAHAAQAAEPPVLLHDLRLDPQENINLAREAPGIVERMTRLL